MQAISLDNVRACVFDAYGTLFDVGSVARSAEDELKELWQPLSELWRSKQLQYTWLRGLAEHHADFWQVTGDALDYAMSSMGLENAALRERLMNQYLHITAYPDVRPALDGLKSMGMKLAILSNGSPHMLAAAVANAGLSDYFDAVLSVDRLAPQRLAIPVEDICFLSSNGWDAWSAKAFGFRVLWCNRFGQTPERIPSPPDGELRDLSELVWPLR
jgi:2-haloacid dehalogenase